jgi:4-aminobutyrate aminotransferase-like enzyme
VQSGFGRTGKMFAVEHFGVEPDIMVLAKGIADGFPLSATIARPEIADSLRPGEHLSTFGGNPVSCAAAIANIEVMRDERLPEESARKGEHVLNRLRAMAETHPLIGEVRGLGLMIGVELVKDRATKVRAIEERDLVVDRMFAKGVLVLGAGRNAIRLCPPLVLTKDQADIALRILDDALAAVGS